jgi:hypothetical protein
MKKALRGPGGGGCSVAEGIRLETWVGKAITLNIPRGLGVPTLTARGETLDHLDELAGVVAATR